MTQGVTVRLSEKAGRERRGHLTVCQRKKCRAALNPVNHRGGPRRRRRRRSPRSQRRRARICSLLSSHPPFLVSCSPPVFCNVLIRVRGSLWLVDIGGADNVPQMVMN